MHACIVQLRPYLCCMCGVDVQLHFAVMIAVSTQPITTPMTYPSRQTTTWTNISPVRPQRSAFADYTRRRLGVFGVLHAHVRLGWEDERGMTGWIYMWCLLLS